MYIYPYIYNIYVRKPVKKREVSVSGLASNSRNLFLKVYKDPEYLIDLGISFQSLGPLYEMAELVICLLVLIL